MIEQRNRSINDTRRVVRGRRIARSSGLVPITMTSTVAPRLSTSTTAYSQNAGDDRVRAGDSTEVQTPDRALRVHRFVIQLSGSVSSYRECRAIVILHSYSGDSRLVGGKFILMVSPNRMLRFDESFFSVHVVESFSCWKFSDWPIVQ